MSETRHEKIDLLPVKNDYVFARLFGRRSHERVLVCLLNAILNGKPHIKDISLDPTEYKKTSQNGKSVRLDIAATSDDGTRLHIEMQCHNEGNIGDRASFCQARLREDELQEGQNYSSIPNIISIWICDESVTKRQSCCHEIVSMYKDNGVDPIEIASEKMRQFIIELSKLEATPKRFLNDMFSIWMMFIRDPNSIPPEFLKIDEVKEAMDELTVMSSDPITRAEYLARQRELNDIRSGMSVKYEEGIEKGKAEGEKIGEHKKAIETAKKMLNDGLSADLVAKYSGLSIADIEGLKK
ncbi:MAG: Rpn family recombination-promoting nuclease/putative transposase [Alphaproteobacteria bacterium]|nr:Rpn family recombination-promoting nuclease/putative transposase [Alphaproteobacteria bacterium]